MITLNAADEPDPPRGFVATGTNLSATYSAPYLYAVRDDTIPLTRVTTSVASGGHLPLIFNLGGGQ